jgi:hypothetical protein
MTERETVTLCFDVEADSVNVALLRDLLQDPKRARLLRIVLGEALGRFLGSPEAFRFTIIGGSLSNSSTTEGGK